MRSYQELSFDERIVIQLQHGHGQSMRSIGRAINRPASTVSRELLNCPVFPGGSNS